MTRVDPVTGRMVADDAWPVLDAFRAAGGRSFEQLGVEAAREGYAQNCRANGLAADPVRRVTDATDAGAPAMRIYDDRSDREQSSPSPVILFLHGGGWVFGDLDTHDSLCRRLATRTGLPVVAVGYRLAPEHPFPAALDDARAAARWIAGLKGRHGIDATSLAVVGDSAGGQLSAVLANEGTDAAFGVPITVQGLLYPATDLTMSGGSHARVTSGFALTSATMEWFAGLYAPGVDRVDPRLSPLRGRVAPVPAFVCTVDNDPLADDGIAYAGALASAGAEVTHVHLAGYAHGLFTSAGRIPRAEPVLDDLAAFVVAHAV